MFQHLVVRLFIASVTMLRVWRSQPLGTLKICYRYVILRIISNYNLFQVTVVFNTCDWTSSSWTAQCPRPWPPIHIMYLACNCQALSPHHHNLKVSQGSHMLSQFLTLDVCEENMFSLRYTWAIWRSQCTDSSESCNFSQGKRIG